MSPVYIVRDYYRNENVPYVFTDVNDAKRYIESLGNEDERYGLVTYSLYTTNEGGSTP